MFKFSEKSIQLLNTVDKKLGILANEVIKVSKVDFAITQGWRDQETQNKYFKDGKSQCDGITKKSKHQDGKAIDILCYDPNTNQPTYDKKFYYYIAGLFQEKADELNKKNDTKNNQLFDIAWGGWWSFEDCCHFELE